jgi:hypothetical protein
MNWWVYCFSTLDELLLSAMKSMHGLLNNWWVVLILCATLGLSPYQPEPHLVDRFRWAYYGGEGMHLLDYIDLLMHASPFVLLLRLVVLIVYAKLVPQKQA